MDFEFTSEQLALQESVRKLAQTELKDNILELDAKKEFNVAAYKKMADMGLMALPFEAKYGGQGKGYVDYAIAVEEVSKVDGSMGIGFSVSVSLYGGSVMGSTASDEVKAKFIKPIAQEGKFGSFALTEPEAGSDVANGKAVARKEGDKYVINADKCFTTNGPLSEYFAVYANLNPEAGPKGVACFIVKKDNPGFKIGRIEDKMGIHGAQVSETFFKECVVSEEDMISPEGKGFALSMKALDSGRIGVAAQGIGIAQGAFDIAVEYLKTRVQFGKPIFKNQYIAFKMAELQMEIDATRLLLYKAAADKDAGRPYSIPAAKAKYMCTNTAMHVTTECVTMLGGNGYMKGYHVERMMRDAKITQIYEGTNEIQKMIVSGPIFK